jgi:uncharacterized Zn finger protein (UPF0148 family)
MTDDGFEIIMIKCAKCDTDYFTLFKSGDSECPLCGHVNKLLVGEDAMNALLEQEKKKAATN